MAIGEIGGLTTRSSRCKGGIEGTSMMMKSIVKFIIRLECVESD